MLTDEILKSFAGANVLVTGGTGLIGRQVVDILADAGARVRIVSLDHVRVHETAEHTHGDLREFSLCKEVTRDMDYVCHLAGIKGSIQVARNMAASHFVPTLMFNTNVLEACRLNAVRKVVYTSSIGAYAQAEIMREGETCDGEPMDIAGWAKRMAELQIQAYHAQYGLKNFAVVRPSNVYGPGDNFDPENAMVIPSLMHRIHSGENPVVVWGDGSAIRDFVYSRDVAAGVIRALYHGTDARFVNLGSGRGHSVRELVETLHAFLEFNYEFDTSKPAGFPRRVLDISLARRIIGYEPVTSLQDGLKATWDWFQVNQDEYLRKKNYFKPEGEAVTPNG